MFENKSLNAFNDSKILKWHADFIQNCSPKTAWGEQRLYHDYYHGNLLELIRHLHRKTVISDHSAQISSDYINSSYQKALNNSDGMSAFYRYIKKEVKIHEQSEIKKASEFAAQHASSLISNTKLSIPEPLSKFSSVLFGSQDSLNLYEEEKQTFETNLAIAPLVNFSMSEILKIRKLSNFAILRGLFSKLRMGNQVGSSEKLIDDIRTVLDECYKELNALSNTHEIDRKHVFEEIKRKKLAKKARVVLTYSNYGILCLGLEEYFLQITNFAGTALFVSVSSEAIGIGLGKTKQKYTETNYKPDTYYDPVNGTIKKLNKEFSQ